MGKGSWKIENARLDNSVKSTKNFGTKDYNAYELLEKILNAKSVAVTQIVSAVKIWNIVSELMESVKLIQSRFYDTVMRKINEK